MEIYSLIWQNINVSQELKKLSIEEAEQKDDTMAWLPYFQSYFHKR